MLSVRERGKLPESVWSSGSDLLVVLRPQFTFIPHFFIVSRAELLKACLSAAAALDLSVEKKDGLVLVFDVDALDGGSGVRGEVGGCDSRSEVEECLEDERRDEGRSNVSELSSSMCLSSSDCVLRGTIGVD
jgi:hypothetical protein